MQRQNLQNLCVQISFRFPGNNLNCAVILTYFVLKRLFKNRSFFRLTGWKLLPSVGKAVWRGNGGTVRLYICCEHPSHVRRHWNAGATTRIQGRRNHQGGRTGCQAAGCQDQRAAVRISRWEPRYTCAPVKAFAALHIRMFFSNINTAEPLLDWTRRF
jgi:hypothetical protein